MPDNPRQPRKPRIAAILPTYNEELNVSGVLDVLRATSMLDEIILVDDGSKDKTARSFTRLPRWTSASRLSNTTEIGAKGRPFSADGQPPLHQFFCCWTPTSKI